MGTFLQKIKRDSSKSCTNSPMTSTIVISTHAPPFLPSWNKIQKQMEAKLNCPSTMLQKNSHILAVSSVDDKNKR